MRYSVFFKALVCYSNFSQLKRFYLIAEHFKKSLNVGLAVSEAKLTKNEIVVVLSECFLWNLLNSFQRYCIFDVGSQVFFSFN